MYGTRPSAKTVRRRKFPPLNRSKIPSTEFCPCWNSVSRTLVLIPGVGMCAPMRYTASSASVKNSRFRRSSMRKRFETAWKKRSIGYSRVFSLRHNFKRAAWLGDLFFSRSAECMGVNRQLGLEFAVAKNLDKVACPAHKPVRAEGLRGHCLARRKNVQFFQVNDRIRDAERIVKAALRHAPMQRHLAAFKATPSRIAAAGLLAPVPRTPGLPPPRTPPPTPP